MPDPILDMLETTESELDCLESGNDQLQGAIIMYEGVIASDDLDTLRAILDRAGARTEAARKVIFWQG